MYTYSSRPQVHYFIYILIPKNRFTVWTLLVSEDQNRLYSGSSDSTIIIWDLQSFQSIQILVGHTGKIYSL
jgi:WD40 repeat protein